MPVRTRWILRRVSEAPAEHGLASGWPAHPSRESTRRGLTGSSASGSFAMLAGVELRVAQRRVLGDGMARVPVDATALAHRSSRILVNFVANDENQSELVARHAWVDELASAFRQSDIGVYVRGRGRALVGRAGRRRMRPIWSTSIAGPGRCGRCSPKAGACGRRARRPGQPGAPLERGGGGRTRRGASTRGQSRLWGTTRCPGGRSPAGFGLARTDWPDRRWTQACQWWRRQAPGLRP
jgi:hypothetical protein